MKVKKVCMIETDSYEQQQYILGIFPESVWIAMGDKTKFFIPIEKMSKAESSVNMWNATKKTRSGE